jgi:hypothetical protein
MEYSFEQNENPGKQEMSVQEKMRAIREKYYRPKLYSRKEAFISLGFRKSKELTDWLRNLGFINSIDYPDNYFIRKKLMEVRTKFQSISLPIDDYGVLIGGSIYDATSITKTFYVPLFTESGIKFFQLLLANRVELDRVLAEIANENQFYKKRLVI